MSQDGSLVYRSLTSLDDHLGIEDGRRTLPATRQAERRIEVYFFFTHDPLIFSLSFMHGNPTHRTLTHGLLDFLLLQSTYIYAAFPW